MSHPVHLMQILRVCWATQTESRPQHNDVQQLQQQQQRSFTHSLHSIHQFSDHFTFFILPKANSAFHPSGVGKWVPALACMVHSDSGWMRGVQVKLWDPLRTRAIPELLRGAFTTRRYTNPRLPLPLHKKTAKKLSSHRTFRRTSIWPTCTNR